MDKSRIETIDLQLKAVNTSSTLRSELDPRLEPGYYKMQTGNLCELTWLHKYITALSLCPSQGSGSALSSIASQAFRQAIILQI